MSIVIWHNKKNQDILKRNILIYDCMISINYRTSFNCCGERRNRPLVHSALSFSENGASVIKENDGNSGLVEIHNENSTVKIISVHHI